MEENHESRHSEQAITQPSFEQGTFKYKIITSSLNRRVGYVTWHFGKFILVKC
jgi:hypothetical protein